MSESAKILLVEDTLTQALIFKRILESAGHIVTIVRSAKEGLEKLEDLTFDVVLTDVTMPEMDGYQFSKAVKTNEKTKNTPVVLLASLVDHSDVLQILESEADSFLFKSYDDAYIVPRLQDILASSHTQTSSDEACREWVGVYGGETRNVKTRLDTAVNLLLASFATNMQQVRVATQSVMKAHGVAGSDK
jgi:CheY-like chemotaxis protein